MAAQSFGQNLLKGAVQAGAHLARVAYAGGVVGSAGASFQLRVSLNSVVNDLNAPMRYEEVLEHEELIMTERAQVRSISHSRQNPRG